MKKIVVVLNTEPEWGGEHHYTLLIMECLKEFRSNIIELSAICSNSFWTRWCRKNRIRVLNVSWLSFDEQERRYHVQYPFFSKIFCMYMTELGRMIHKEKIDAILGTNQGMFIPNLDTKVIVPVHDLMHRYEGKFPEVSSTYKDRELVFSSVAKYAWCVLTDSKMGKRQFIESYSNYMKKNLKYIISLPFVVSEHIFEKEDEVIGLPSKYVFYPAQFWLHKNHLNLLEAIHLLIDSISDIHLVLSFKKKL